MRSHLLRMCVIILVLVMRGYGADPSANPGVASLADVIRGLKASALDATALRQLGGTSGFKEYHGNPVLKLGEKGQWDAGALGSMTVLKVGDFYHMYYQAWGDKGTGRLDYYSLQIGHAVSPDGLHWAKDPANPVLSPEPGSNWDADGVWDPFVIYEDGKFKLWYGGGDTDHCDWAFAVSADGSHFVKKSRVSHLGNVEDDRVVHDAAKSHYYMYYWDRRRAPLGLMRAESPNETDFDFGHAVPIKIEGEKYAGAYKFSHVFLDDGTWYMYYRNFGPSHCADGAIRFATSTDGLHWTSRNKNLLKGHDGEVLKVADRLFIIYYGPQGYFDRRGCDIRVAVYTGDLKDLQSK